MCVFSILYDKKGAVFQKSRNAYSTEANINPKKQLFLKIDNIILQRVHISNEKMLITTASIRDNSRINPSRNLGVFARNLAVHLSPMRVFFSEEFFYSDS